MATDLASDFIPRSFKLILRANPPVQTLEHAEASFASEEAEKAKLCSELSTLVHEASTAQTRKLDQLF